MGQGLFNKMAAEDFVVEGVFRAFLVEHYYAVLLEYDLEHGREWYSFDDWFLEFWPASYRNGLGKLCMPFPAKPL